MKLSMGMVYCPTPIKNKIYSTTILQTIMLPFGVQSTQLHINYWNENDFEKFEKFLRKYHKNILTYNDVIKQINDNFIFKIINIILEKTLKLKRVIA